VITVLRMAGPNMAWPSASKYRYRHTESSPTLSVIHGLLAAAAGISRNDARPPWIEDIKVAVRLDQPGSVFRDFHTINPIAKERYFQLSEQDRKKLRMVKKGSGDEHKRPIVTERYYRQDEAVMVFLDDPSKNCLSVLSKPKFALYAGRKACVFSFPFIMGQVSGNLEQALMETPTASQVDQALEAVLFERPHQLPYYKKLTSRPERPAGLVGEEYLTQGRYSVQVKPPQLKSWFEVLEKIKGSGHVAL
jgi:CRISPR system Cascade subunit CasD